MSYTDALSRISQIQQQITELSTGAAPTSSSASGSTATSAADAAATASSATFATALAQAQDPDDTSSAFPVDSASTLTGDSGLATTLASALTGGTTLGTTTAATATASGAALPSSASSMLTSDQQQFASTLAADTGLSPGVVSAWLLAEESGGAAQSRQAAGNNDWLNIGYTDSGTYGSADSVWSDPVTAATATAGWLKGQDTIPGYGTASANIQGILGTVGQTPQAQIAALQSSGWASSGYPDLSELYGQVTA